jgi:hypothetical protein
MEPPTSTFPLLRLSDGLLDRVVGFLGPWELAAARSACRALRAASGRRARRLVFSPASLRCESSGDKVVQVRQLEAGVAGGLRWD